jgi:hypothetical protein
MARSRSFSALLPAVLAPDEPPGIAEVRRRRAGLQSAMGRLEAALAAPGAAHDGWSVGVMAALAGLRETWSHHIADTEAPGAFLDEITDEAPRLAGPVAHMRREHAEVSGAIERLTRRVAVGPGPEGESFWIDALRADATAMLGELARHRQRGADLVYEAFAVDLGGGA